MESRTSSTRWQDDDVERGFMRRIRFALLPVLVAAVCALGACTDGNGDGNGASEQPSANGDGGSEEPAIGDGPDEVSSGIVRVNGVDISQLSDNDKSEPVSMCEAGQAPVVAAYDADTGKHRWVACADEQGYAKVLAATGSRVFVALGGGPRRNLIDEQAVVLGLDAKNGDEVWRGTEAKYKQQLPKDAEVLSSEPPVVGGVRLTGGQDDPLVAFDTKTGKQRWSEPDAHLVYDDVWAVGDGAVFAVDGGEFREGVRNTHVVGYEIATGKVRWERMVNGYLWPWHVQGDRLFVLWDNLEVVDTDDGRTVWKTGYKSPESGFPRMTGVVANDDLVFVSFTTVASGGD